MSEAAYAVLDALAHDGIEYPAGAVIMLDDAAAQPLIDLHVIRSQAEQMYDAPGLEPKPEPEEADDGADRRTALMAAMAALEPGDPDHWTQSGLPEIRALNALSGLSGITAAERDAAWQAFQSAAPAAA